MLLRSFDSLNFPLAWRRVRTWAQSGGLDVPDRLPYEVIDRVLGDQGPTLSREHHVHEAALVVDSKKSGTIRPFVRLHPHDWIVYQALVDALAPTIESALPPRDHVAAYRQALTDDDNAFAGSLQSDEFKAGVSAVIEAAGPVFVLQTDISGYYLGIRPERLADELLQITNRPEVVTDLVEMLGLWQHRGVRGLPQGVRTSGPLANFYLSTLDRVLGNLPIPFYRWADDMWAICESFSEARRVQDEIERHLYTIGLTLNGEKTRIRRASTAVKRLESATKRFAREREMVGEGAAVLMDGYTDEESLPDADDVDIEWAHTEVDRLVAALDDDDLPDEFHADTAHVLRQLEAIDDNHALAAVPHLLRRAPDLARDAMRYAVAVGAGSSEAVEIFAEVLRPERFTRDSEKLIICHMALSLEPRPGSQLGDRLGWIAINDPHALTRARALIAWGLHSDDHDLLVADRFLNSAAPQWRLYAFISIQSKDSDARNLCYQRWAGGGDIGSLTELLKAGPIEWGAL